MGLQDELRRSLEQPHAESLELAESRLDDRVWGLPEEDTRALFDAGAGRAIRWVPGEGWAEGEDASADVSRAALEVLALQDLRAEKITVAQARRLLEFASRYVMDGFLKRHGILLPLSVEDVERDAETAERCRNRS